MCCIDKDALHTSTRFLQPLIRKTRKPRNHRLRSFDESAGLDLTRPDRHINPQPEPIQQNSPQALDQKPLSKSKSKKPVASPDKSPAPQLATVPEETAQNHQPDSPKGEAQALLSSPPPAKPENVLANPLTNLAIAQVAPAKVSDQSTQTDLETPSSTEES
jgi:hypothetical protein